MISSNQIKYIKSLQLKKFRDKHQSFLIEGLKLVNEALKSSISLEQLFIIEKYANQFEGLAYEVISEKEMSRISSFKTPPGVLATVKYFDLETKKPNLQLYLDDIRDPGNMGTIIRTAEAFQVKRIICSENTVDRFNSKAVQASMGSVFRMPIAYCDLENLKKSTEGINVYSLQLDGTSIYKSDLSRPTVFVIGNESNGVSENFKKTIDFTPIKIPINKTVESLNAAVACTTVLAEFNRRFYE